MKLRCAMCRKSSLTDFFLINSICGQVSNLGNNTSNDCLRHEVQPTEITDSRVVTSGMLLFSNVYIYVFMYCTLLAVTELSLLT